MVALDRRRFLTPIVRAVAGTPSTSCPRTSRPCPTASPARTSSPVEMRSAGPPGIRDRPACRSSTAPSPRSSARSSRRSRRAITTCSSGASTRSHNEPHHPMPAALLPASLPAHRALRRRPMWRACPSGSIGACRRSPRTGSRSGTRRSATDRRSSSSTAPPCPVAVISTRTWTGSPRRSGSTCPTRAGTGPRGGTRQRASRRRRLVADLLAFVDALRLETFHLLGFSMGAMTALHRRGGASRAPRDPRPRRHQPRARAAGERRATAHGPRSDRARRPGLGARPGRPARRRPGARRVAAAAAGDLARTSTRSRCSRRRSSVGSTSRPWSCAATVIRSSRSSRPGR